MTKNGKNAIGQSVHVVVDRPLGSRHPKHKDLAYEVNYGYVPGILGGDGEEQDVYILGVDEPLSAFDGVVIAVLDRADDNEEKWVAAPEGVDFSDEEILARTHFVEKYIKTDLRRDGNL